MHDATVMQRCLELASHGRGKVGNGALVGAVLVRDQQIIVEAFHTGFGQPHAEKALLDSIGLIEPNDVLYVNLEPCCHQGKTPPCIDAIVKKEIKHVVYGMTDPDPRMAGEGITQLRQSGVDVRGPVLKQQCARLNRGYVSVRTKNRPWITLKKAQTPDGKIAKEDGSTLCITSDSQNRWSHEFLRARHDAILVGSGTVNNDNPNLNTRFIQNTPLLYRVILDPYLRINLDATVVSDANSDTTIVVASAKSDREKLKILQSRGTKILHVAVGGTIFDWDDLWQCLMNLDDGDHGITSILVEGGTATWRTFTQAGIVDEEIVLVGDAAM